MQSTSVVHSLPPLASGRHASSGPLTLQTPEAQAMPQAPQLEGSARRLAQVPEQHSPRVGGKRPAPNAQIVPTSTAAHVGKAQTPSAQICPTAHPASSQLRTPPSEGGTQRPP